MTPFSGEEVTRAVRRLDDVSGGGEVLSGSKLIDTAPVAQTPCDRATGARRRVVSGENDDGSETTEIVCTAFGGLVSRFYPRIAGLIARVEARSCLRWIGARCAGL